MNIAIDDKVTSAEKTLLAQLAGREKALADSMLREYGLPSRKVEAYHYTDLKALLGQVPPLAGPDLPDSIQRTGMAGPDFAGSLKITIANGMVASLPEPAGGVSASEVSGSALGERKDVLVAMNRALVDRGLDIKISGKTGQILHLDWQLQGDAVHVATSVGLELEEGARAVVVETINGSDQAHLANLGSRARLGAGAELTHVIIDVSSKKVTRLHTVEYEIGRDAQLHNLMVNSGAGLSRTQVFSRFAGEGANGDFSGLNLVGNDQHCDITLDTAHGVANTTSTQKFKAVVRDRARAVFQGMIRVEPVAQKTDARMMVQGLMLSEEAQVLNKPELEIFADDVQCGHGSTCGELDRDSLFYLMSRGIRREEASAMLIRAFVEEVLDSVSDEQLHGELSAIVQAWLREGGDGVPAGKDAGK